MNSTARSGASTDAGAFKIHGNGPRVSCLIRRATSRHRSAMATRPDDPVYHAIERHRRAYADVIAAAMVDSPPSADDAQERERAALEVLAGTQPLSVHG